MWGVGFRRRPFCWRPDRPRCDHQSPRHAGWCRQLFDGRLWHLSDLNAKAEDVCFRVQRGRAPSAAQGQPLTQSGHWGAGQRRAQLAHRPADLLQRLLSKVEPNEAITRIVQINDDVDGEHDHERIPDHVRPIQALRAC